MGGDPAGVPAHHLDDHHAVVRLGGRVQPVDRVGDDLHGGLEAERHVGAAEVVVDRLRHAHDRHAVFVQAQRDAERVLAADRDQHVDAAALERAPHERGAVAAVGVGVGARGAEDRAAAREDPGRALERELHRLVAQDARPAVAEAEERVSAFGEAAADDRADHAVQPGAVASAGEQRDRRHRLIFLDSLAREELVGERRQPRARDRG